MGGARGYSFEGIDVLVSLESLIVLVLHAVRSSTRNGTNLTSKGSSRNVSAAGDPRHQRRSPNNFEICAVIESSCLQEIQRKRKQKESKMMPRDVEHADSSES